MGHDQGQEDRKDGLVVTFRSKSSTPRSQFEASLRALAPPPHPFEFSYPLLTSAFLASLKYCTQFDRKWSAAADFGAIADSADHLQTPVPAQSPGSAIQEKTQEAAAKRPSAMRHKLSILQLLEPDGTEAKNWALQKNGFAKRVGAREQFHQADQIYGNRVSLGIIPSQKR